MKLENKTILLISPEPWDHIFVSKHHYAVHLGRRGNKVFFLNPPGVNMKVSETGVRNVFSVTYQKLVSGLRFLPRSLQQRIMRRKYVEIERLCGAAFDLIWSFDNSVFYDFDAFPPHTFKINHIVDLNQDFNTQRAAATANVCLASTQFIEERLRSFNKNVYKIHHGYNEVNDFAAIKMQGASSVKAVYSGNLDMPYLDWKILQEIVRAHPNVDFFFIGPSRADSQNEFKKEVISQANVFLLGKLDTKTLQSFLREADILLVSYLEPYAKEQSNPHKMMEYLGSGKVIVSTFTGEFKFQTDMIEMAVQNSALPSIFSKVVENLDYYNTPALMHRRKTFALENTYDRQIDRINLILKNYPRS